MNTKVNPRFGEVKEFATYFNLNNPVTVLESILSFIFDMESDGYSVTDFNVVNDIGYSGRKMVSITFKDKRYFIEG